jgi:hypothetical protein
MALRSGRHIVAKNMRNRTNFTHGNISGSWIGEVNIPSFGYLPVEYQEKLKKDLADKDVYVIFSYRTPIAWTFDQDWVIPKVNYSVTTTHHQSVVTNYELY